MINFYIEYNMPIVELHEKLISIIKFLLKEEPILQIDKNKCDCVDRALQLVFGKIARKEEVTICNGKEIICRFKEKKEKKNEQI